MKYCQIPPVSVLLLLLMHLAFGLRLQITGTALHNRFMASISRSIECSCGLTVKPIRWSTIGAAIDDRCDDEMQLQLLFNWISISIRLKIKRLRMEIGKLWGYFALLFRGLKKEKGGESVVRWEWWYHTQKGSLDGGWRIGGGTERLVV